MASIDDIDAILPQTQCGLCGHGGCKPYATALANQQDSIDKCPPGGLTTLTALGNLLDVDPKPFVPAMQAKAKAPVVAFIQEDNCIGCTKCIQACPVDAIVGSGKLMHTVLKDECTGCELCVEPCPVDCIDLIAIDESTDITSRREQYRARFNARNNRLQRDKTRRAQQQAKATTLSHDNKQALDAKRAEIAAAVARVKAKKGQTE